MRRRPVLAAVVIAALATSLVAAGILAFVARGARTAPSADAAATSTPGTSQSLPATDAVDAASTTAAATGPTAAELRASLDIAEDYHPEFSHGPKPAAYQKYIVLHDTEGDGRPEDIVSYWAGNGNLVAAHFVIGKDGHIAQCVPLDDIAHHAGYGDTGHNALFGVEDESRDDKLGTESIGSADADYGMNSYSVGIELVHVGGEGDYPAAQLDALDGLIAYIDAYYAEQGQTVPSTIIDHKAWRTGNSDTSPEFAGYLANYQDRRTHN